MTSSKIPRTKAQRWIAISLFGALSLFVIQAVAEQSEHNPNPNMMAQHQNIMMGMGPGRGMMGMGHDSQTMAEMGVIHELVVNHDRIKRTVTNLPDGIRTVTESDDPQIAKLIKEHVATMDQRVSAKSDPGLPYSPEQISAELAHAGLALAESHDFLPRQHFLIFRAR